MRIQAQNSATVSTTPLLRRSNGGGFALPVTEGSVAATGGSALRSVGGIETLLALQGLEASEERRRRAVRGGHAALDALDRLKVGLLGGHLDRNALGQLRATVNGLKAASGDGALDVVLAEISLRVEVELAKLGS